MDPLLLIQEVAAEQDGQLPSSLLLPQWLHFLFSPKATGAEAATLMSMWMPLRAHPPRLLRLRKHLLHRQLPPRLQRPAVSNTRDGCPRCRKAAGTTHFDMPSGCR